MFRLELHALWSHDYEDPLSRLLAKVCACDLEQARKLVEGIAGQSTLTLEAHTPTEANFLAGDLLQFGVYVEVQQISQITEKALVTDAINDMPASMQHWYVLMDEKTKKPLYLLDRDNLVSLRYENISVTEQVGEEMLKRGALPIDRERMAELDGIMDELRPQFEQMEKQFMSDRITLIKQRRYRRRHDNLPKEAEFKEEIDRNDE
jgi:hypothetical protein